MKNIIALIFLAIASPSYSQEPVPSRTFGPGMEIPLGPRAVPFALSHVISIEVTARDESGRDSWTGISTGFSFKSVAEFKNAIAMIKPSLEQIDPRDRIDVEARCMSEDGIVLFSAYTSLWMEKGYDWLNRPVWGITEPGYLYFQLENLPIGFSQGVESAWFEFNNGGFTSLEVFDGDTIIIPGWMAWQNNVTLNVNIGGFSYQYDGETGQVVPSASVRPDLLMTDIRDLRTAKIDEGLNLTLTTYPEYGSNPCTELTSTVNGIATINVRSHFGYKPIAIHVTVMRNVYYNNHWELVEPDENGSIKLSVTSGQPVLIWAEFPNQVNNIGDQNG